MQRQSIGKNDANSHKYLTNNQLCKLNFMCDKKYYMTMSHYIL